MHVEKSLRADTNHPAAILPSLLNPAFRAALEDYIAWAQGSGPNPGVPAEVSFSSLVANAKFSIRGEAVDIELPPGSEYNDIAEFMDQAANFAARKSGLEQRAP